MASEDLFLPENSEDITEQLERDVVDSRAKQISSEGDPNGATAGTEDNTTVTNGSKSVAETEQADAKLTHLPLARVRNIMKLDPDLQVASNEAVFAVTKAVELFVESLARESYSYTVQAKKKTIQKRDVDMAIANVDSLMFLDGAMTF